MPYVLNFWKGMAPMFIYLFLILNPPNIYNETIDPLEKMEMSLTGGAKTEVATCINEIDSIWNITTVID